MHTIVEALFQQAHRRPERPVLFWGEYTISYGQLSREVEACALALRTWGLQPGDRVALFLENCPEFIIAYLGTQLAGGIVVPINTQYRQGELGHIVVDAGVRLCVTSALGAEELRSLQAPDLEALLLVDASGDSLVGAGREGLAFADFVAQRHPGGQAAEHPGLPMPRPDAPAVIAYTSGTTGRSKGALLYHRNLIANSLAVTTAWRWTAGDRLLLTLPLFHTHGLMVGVHGTLVSGGSAVLHRKFDAANVFAALRADPAISLFSECQPCISACWLKRNARGRQHTICACLSLARLL